MLKVCSKEFTWIWKGIGYLYDAKLYKPREIRKSHNLSHQPYHYNELGGGNSQGGTGYASYSGTDSASNMKELLDKVVPLAVVAACGIFKGKIKQYYNSCVEDPRRAGELLPQNSGSIGNKHRPRGG